MPVPPPAATARLPPLQVERRGAAQCAPVGRVAHLQDHEGLGCGRQFFEAPRDSGQGGFVTDQQVPVMVGCHHERAAGAADGGALARRGLALLRRVTGNVAGESGA